MMVHPIPAALSPYAGLNASAPDWRNPAFAHQTLRTPGPPSVLAQPGPYGVDLNLEIERFADAAESLVRTETFDVIHAHDWMTFPAALRARLQSGKPIVVHIHSTEFDRRGPAAQPEIAALERAGCETADRVIAVSHQTRNQLIERYGIAPDKIEVVHNAVRRREALQHRPPSPTFPGKIVLFLGRVTAQKGPDFFVEAAGRILKTRPDITFVMAGAGDQLPRLIERVGQLRIGAHFHFTGFLQGADVERLYSMAHVYVMPSVAEPFGIAPLEALAYDVPVIIARQAGVGEVLHHALKVDFWDVADLADKILAILDHPALSRELLRQGRRELRSLCWDAAAQKVETLYRSLSGG
jgi:glycosyltransferase involved in cell wall biosynthesis